MAALQIRWELAETLVQPAPVVTGEKAEDRDEDEAEASLYAQLDKPVFVLVADPTIALADLEGLGDVIFQNEKIGLAMKAFRAVRMAPEDAETEPLLAEEGRTVPRIMIVDPAKERVRVLEERRIKVSTVYREMKRAARRFYEENVDRIVKKHLKILTERDKLHNEEQRLREKESKLAEEGRKGERKLAKVREELDELKEEVEALDADEKELWTLTPRNAAA